MTAGQIIKLDDFLTMLADQIASICINMNSKSFPSNFESKTVKTWTKRIVEKVEPIKPDKGNTPDAYNQEWYIKFCIVQSPNGRELSYTQYSTDDVRNILEEVFSENQITYIQNNIMYVALFVNVIKVLEQFISENFQIYVSTFYNDKVLVFSPTGSYNYDLPIDISDYTTENAYNDTLIKNYLTNLSQTLIYSIDDSKIHLLSYGITSVHGVPAPIEKNNFNVTFSYTSGSNSFTINISHSDIADVYYRTATNKSWTSTDQRTFSATKTTTFYFYIKPISDYVSDYNNIGSDNKLGFTLTRGSRSVNPYSETRSYEYQYWSEETWALQYLTAQKEHPNGWYGGITTHGFGFYIVWKENCTSYDTQYYWTGAQI